MITIPSRCEVGGRALLGLDVAELGRRRPDRHHAPSLSGLRPGPLLQSVQREELRRTEDVVVVADRDRAPPAARRKRHLGRRALGGAAKAVWIDSSVDVRLTALEP
jgi:hypothetical protein